MIAVDTNLLVYAHREDAAHHRAARAVIAGLAESPATWAIPWPCVHEFLAVVTHPRIWTRPTPMTKALDQVDAWIESPGIALLTETAAHWRTLRDLVQASRVDGPRVHDARVAALCLQH